MRILSLDKDDYWKAIIEWTHPCKWNKEEKCVYLTNKYKREYGIYRFERRHGNQKSGRENIYIGHAFDQTFDIRLHQGFHEAKIKKAGIGEIWVSLGIINLKKSKHLKQRYREIEKILIYFTQPKQNEKEKSWGPDCQFEIFNKGHRGPLPYYIRYPVAEIKERFI